MENEQYIYKFTNKEGENIIIFVEEIILNILNEKNPIYFKVIPGVYIFQIYF